MMRNNRKEQPRGEQPRPHESPKPTTVWFRSCFRVFAALVIVGGAIARAAEPDVTVRASVDRTAMWVADRVTYTIDITCQRGADVLAGDLSRDKLKVEGLEVVDGDSDRSASGDTTTYRFRYVLTTYRVDAPTLTIAPLTVRYAVRRAGQRLDEAAPAGEVLVPGATIAWRSVLPDDQDVSGIRSDKPPHARARRFAALQPIGIGLLLVSTVPAVAAIAALGVRARRPRVRRSARAVRHEERVSLEAVRAMDVDTIDGRRAVFDRLDALVRDHLREVGGVPGASLTSADTPLVLAGNGRKIDAELVTSVLAACERARYAPEHAMPSADACRSAVESVEKILRV